MIKKIAMVAVVALMLLPVYAQAQTSSGSQTLNISDWSTAQRDPDANATLNEKLRDGFSPSAALTNQYATNKGIDAYNEAIAAGQTPAQATSAANQAALNALKWVSNQSTNTTVNSLGNMMADATGAAIGVGVGAVSALGTGNGSLAGMSVGLGMAASSMASFGVDAYTAYQNVGNNNNIMGSGVNLPSSGTGSSGSGYTPGGYTTGGGSGPYASANPVSGTNPVTTSSVSTSAMGTPLGNAVQAANAANGVGQAPAPANMTGSAPANVAGSPTPASQSPSSLMPKGKMATMMAADGGMTPPANMTPAQAAAMAGMAAGNPLGAAAGAMPQIPATAPTNVAKSGPPPGTDPMAWAKANGYPVPTMAPPTNTTPPTPDYAKMQVMMGTMQPPPQPTPNPTQAQMYQQQQAAAAANAPKPVAPTMPKGMKPGMSGN